MPQSESRDFKGVWIPRDIWLDDRLSAIEKVLLIEIDSLSGGELGCIKTNETLAEFCQCSVRTVTQGISNLKELGLVYVESFNGRQRVLRSCLANFASLPSKNCEAASQNLRGTYIDSNTSSNPSSTSNICAEKPKPRKTKPRKSKPFIPPTLEEVQAYVREKGYHFNPKSFLDYYEASGWHFKNGKPVKNWKQCCVTWESNHRYDRPAPTQSQQQELDLLIGTWHEERWGDANGS